MAILLYRFIRGKVRESKNTKEEREFESIGQKYQSPAQATGNVTPQYGEMEPKNTAQLGDQQSITHSSGLEKDGSNVEPPSTESKDTRTKEEKRAMRIYRAKLVAGLFLP